MSEVDKNRKIEFTVLKVDSIPCSIVGNKMIFNYEGTTLSEPWILKWPMPWIEEEFKKIVLKFDKVTKQEKRSIYNPEEPDQYVEVLIKSYIDLTVPKLVDKIADRFSEREAVINCTGSRRLKYKDFKKSINDLAKGLISIGVNKGDNVAVWAVNSPEVVISQFGISKTGGVFVPFNAYEKQKRMEELLKQSETHTLIMQVGAKGTENIELLFRICPELCESEPGKLRSKKFPKLKNVIVLSGDEYPGTFMWSDILKDGGKISNEILIERQNQISIDDVVHIIYTSGSTGVPKGVMLSHRNIIENAKAMSDLMELTKNDIMCILAPLFHCFGCIAGTMAAVLNGCAMVMVNRFKTEITLSLIEKEKCTVLSGVPTLFIASIEHLQEEYYDISSLRTGIVAGATCSAKLLYDIKNIMGMDNIILSYGLTETSPCVAAANECSDLIENSVGKAIPGVEIKVIDCNTKEEVAPGQEGEILVRGYNVMQGYYNMPDESAKSINSDGWMHTGDIGCLTEDGYICIKGRCKDVIIRCGENISPKEIEDCIGNHKGVVEVCVVGVPDEVSGEEIMAFIRLKENCKSTEKEIKEFCKGKLSTNKIPRYVKFIDQFPLSGSGKVLKKELRESELQLINNRIMQKCNA
ncbi:MAG TPA: AMP-binding protein [Clostridiales bacterium]|nr:AMP-binding protein [Clostridiales bacterium]